MIQQPSWNLESMKLTGSLSDDDGVPQPTRRLWRKSDKHQQTKLIRQALAFQQRLEDAVQVVARLSSSGPAGSTQHPQATELQRVSHELTTSSTGLHDFFSDFVSTFLYNERQQCAASATSAASPARRVFDIPEVLEIIIGNLKVGDILRAMQVDKTMCAAITSSPVIQEILHLRPSSSRLLETPFTANPLSYELCRRKKKKKRNPSEAFPGFTCYSGSHEDMGLVEFVAEFAAELPRIGTRCRSMLVCQPPIHQMGVYASCCSSNPYMFWLGAIESCPQAMPKYKAYGSAPPHGLPEPPFEILTSDTGITVGDLYDMTVKHRALHYRCPWAFASEHDTEGELSVRVSLGGTVHLKRNEATVTVSSGWPYFPPPPPTWPPANATYLPPRSDDLLERYVAAKGQGKHKVPI